MFDLCQCETSVQMEDNEGGIGEKEMCKYTCSSWRSTVAFLSSGDSDEPVAKIIVTRQKRIFHPVGSTLFLTRSLAGDIIFRLYQEIRRNISTHIFTHWYSVHVGEYFQSALISPKVRPSSVFYLCCTYNDLGTKTVHSHYKPTTRNL